MAYGLDRPRRCAACLARPNGAGLRRRV